MDIPTSLWSQKVPCHLEPLDPDQSTSVWCQKVPQRFFHFMGLDSMGYGSRGETGLLVVNLAANHFLCFTEVYIFTSRNSSSSEILCFFAEYTQVFACFTLDLDLDLDLESLQAQNMLAQAYCPSLAFKLALPYWLSHWVFYTVFRLSDFLLYCI